MKVITAISVLLLVTGCARAPVMKEHSFKPSTETARFENAIARKLLSQAARNAAGLNPGHRRTYLRQMKTQIDQSVDLGQLDTSQMQEYRVLEYLVGDVEDDASSYLASINLQSSLSLSIADYQRIVSEELLRISNELPADKLEDVRTKATYPDESHPSLQQYLDDLSDAMLKAQIDWHDLVSRYDETQIGIEGDSEAHETFVMHGNNLLVSLKDVSTLPDFELASLAIYFGFPGFSVLGRNDREDSLRQLLSLPGYEFGWSGYVLEQIALKSKDAVLFYFLHLNAVLAEADLMINTGEWSEDEALDHLADKTPYSRQRLSLHLNTIRRLPGYYVAALAGKAKFNEIRVFCESIRQNCDADLHQQIIDQGPLPFDAFRLTAQ